MHRGHLDMEVATMPAKPEDAASKEAVAALITFLASDRSSYMTGSTIDVAGGR